MTRFNRRCPARARGVRKNASIGHSLERLAIETEVPPRDEEHAALQRENTNLKLLVDVMLAASDTARFQDALGDALARICERANWPLGHVFIVKIASEDFDAIGTVAHARRTGELTTAGLRFQTVRFPLARGNFRSLKA